MEKGSEIVAVRAGSKEVVEAAKEDLSEYVLAMETFILKAKANGKAGPTVLFQGRGGFLPEVRREGVVNVAGEQSGPTAQ